MHRFYGEFSFDNGEIDLSSYDIAHQLIDVLKMKKGERLGLFNVEGQEATCSITEINKKQAIVVVEKIEQKIVPTKRIHFFCAILKKDNFELVVQKVTEVGVTDIHPMITDRTIKQGLRFDRLERIAIEAVEQSGRIFIPTIHEIEEFDSAVAIAEQEDGAHFCLDMSSEPLQSAVSTSVSSPTCFFIGPEGGWSDAERTVFKNKKNWHIVSLGDAVLRAETAAIVAAYLIANS